MMKDIKSIFIMLFILVGAFGCDGDDADADIQAIYESHILDPENLPPSENKCGGENDRIHMRADNLEFARNVERCVTVSGFSAYLDQAKFQKIYPQMTAGCISCFAKMTECASEHCGATTCGPWPIGFGSTSDECIRCQILSCHADMVVCSGIQSKDIPRLR